MTFPVLSANGPSGYNLTRSLRFRASASANMTKTFASAPNGKILTISFWMKRGYISNGSNFVFAGYDGSSGNAAGVRLYSNDNMEISTGNTGSGNVTLSQVFRDPSAWYHIVVGIDTTQATSANRIKVYVNGAQVTSFSTASYPTQNQTTAFLMQNANNGLGSNWTTNSYFDGYFAEFNVVDGQQLTASSFGSTNSTTGVWQPAAYTGTYGTNGFYLPFTDNSALTTSSNAGLGKDFSGNANYWVTNNISITAGATYDSMTDVPTLTSATAANFAVLNPLAKSTYASITGGNLNISWSNNASANLAANPATISLPSSGKWYFELSNASADGNNGIGVGICNVTQIANGGDSTPGTYYLYRSDASSSYIGYYSNAGGGTTGSTFLGGAVCGIAVDLDNGKFWAAINNTWQGGGNPAAGTSPGYSGISNSVTWVPFVGGWNWTGTATSASINFGQRPFTYTPPSGFAALNTYNLPASTVPNGAAYMAATLYTGTGATQTITNTVGSVSFTPDFVWVKARSTANSHLLADIVRGSTKVLLSNDTAAEITDANYTTFVSGGFSESGNGNENNNSGKAYVAWNWKAGGTAVSNTSGSITSSVSANTTSGFSVVTYTGTGAAATVGHGLGVAPSMIIVKVRSTTNDWPVYHSGLPTPATQALFLDLTNAASTGSSAWNSTNPTSSVFSLGVAGSSNTSGATYVAYCFAQIAGFSAFGSYTGNGSTDGPFVYTGFRPRWIMLKNSSEAYDWYVFDTSRNTYNLTNISLYPDSNIAEGTSSVSILDVLSNGFKMRGASGGTNPVSTSTMIYAAFAENPFQNALAR